MERWEVFSLSAALFQLVRWKRPASWFLVHKAVATRTGVKNLLFGEDIKIKHWTPFSQLFLLYCGNQCTYACCPHVSFTTTPHNFLSKPLAAFPHNLRHYIGQQWIGMNAVALTMINSRKEIGLPKNRTHSPLFSGFVCYRLSWQGSAKSLTGERVY